jgi:hypothetical protein
MAEMVSGYWDVLQRYLYMAVYFGPLAVQAGFCPGCDVCGKTLPNIPGGDEAAGRPHAGGGWPRESVKIPVPEGLWAPAIGMWWSRSPTF